MSPYPGKWKVDVFKGGEEKKVYVVGPSPVEAGLCKEDHVHEEQDCSISEDIAEISPSNGWISLKMAVATAREIVRAHNTALKQKRRNRR